MVREPDATMEPAPQDMQLMSKHRVFSFKPQLRLEGRGQNGKNETEQPDHSASLSDSITASTRIRFSVHTRIAYGPFNNRPCDARDDRDGTGLGSAAPAPSASHLAGDGFRRVGGSEGHRCRASRETLHAGSTCQRDRAPLAEVKDCHLSSSALHAQKFHGSRKTLLLHSFGIQA